MDPLLRTINLSKRFGTLLALQRVSLEVYPGEVVGLAGRSGSGKSVTAQSIMGIVPSPPAKQIAGEVLLHQRNGSRSNGSGHNFDH